MNPPAIFYLNAEAQSEFPALLFVPLPEGKIQGEDWFTLTYT
jgi:hypothetical protein